MRVKVFIEVSLEYLTRMSKIWSLVALLNLQELLNSGHYVCPRAPTHASSNNRLYNSVHIQSSRTI